MAEQIEKRKRILSGIQPTGTPTLGNYIGAVRNWPCCSQIMTACIWLLTCTL